MWAMTRPTSAAAFLKSHKAAALGTYVDTELALLHAFGAYGLPTTVLIDPKRQGSRQGARAGRMGRAAIRRLFQESDDS